MLTRSHVLAMTQMPTGSSGLWMYACTHQIRNPTPDDAKAWKFGHWGTAPKAVMLWFQGVESEFNGSGIALACGIQVLRLRSNWAHQPKSLRLDDKQTATRSWNPVGFRV